MRKSFQARFHYFNFLRMKKTIVVVFCISVLSIQVFGQDINTVLSQLSKHENIEKITIGSFGMFFVKLLGGVTGGEGYPQGVKGIKAFELLTLNDKCPANEKAAVWKQLKELKDDKVYATLMSVKDDEDHVRFLMKKEKDTIKELLMIVLSAKEEVVIIRLKGKFNESDWVDWLTKSNKKSNER
jgi:hypothetical protein